MRTCRLSDRLLAALACLALLYAGFVSASDKLPVVEKLEYEASYQGPLTANSKISIARISLQTRAVSLPSIKDKLFETSMRVSSSASSFVEEQYPFRIRYLSLYRVNPVVLIAMEKYKLTDELKHEVVWMDHDNGRVARYKKRVGNSALPAVLGKWLDTQEHFSYYKPARHKTQDGLVDRLAMLQSLRSLAMSPGVRYNFPVTDGKRLLHYRVDVLGLEQIQLAGKRVQAWKLVLNGFYTKKGVTSPRHAPIHLWLSNDAARIPLRFAHQHPLGSFTVELR